MVLSSTLLEQFKKLHLNQPETVEDFVVAMATAQDDHHVCDMLEAMGITINDKIMRFDHGDLSGLRGVTIGGPNVENLQILQRIVHAEDAHSIHVFFTRFTDEEKRYKQLYPTPPADVTSMVTRGLPVHLQKIHL